MGTGMQNSAEGQLLAKNCKLRGEMDVVRNGGQPRPEEKVFPQSCSPGSWPGVRAGVFLAEGTAWAKAWGQEGAWEAWGKARRLGWPQSLCVLLRACTCMCVHVCLCTYLCVCVVCICKCTLGYRCQAQAFQPGK